MSITTDYPRGRLIAHAGGAIDGLKYSNTLEAFQRSAARVCLVELDICRAADGLIVAHDGTEKRYGIHSTFAETTLDEFRHTKFANRLTVMTVKDLVYQVTKTSSNVVMDIKSRTDAEYRRCVEEISELCVPPRSREQLVPQVYNQRNLEDARNAGFDNAVLALWKSFGDIRTPECQACIDDCIRDKPDGFFALSLAARHFWRDGAYVGDRLAHCNFERAGMVFLHGQPAEAEAALLAKGFGLFSHNAVELAETLEA